MKMRIGDMIVFANTLHGKGDSTGVHQHDENGHATICISGGLRIERWMEGYDIKDPSKNKEVIEIPPRGFAYIEQYVPHNVIAMGDDADYMCVWSLVVDENGIELPGQIVDPELKVIDVWEKESEAPWLSY